MTEQKHRSTCPITSAIDILGDRWTLVVIRDIFFGKKRYSDFLTGPEKITTNILAVRLKQLEDTGLVTKTLYQDHPPRYEYTLTPKGAALTSVLTAIWDWSQEWELKKPADNRKPSPFRKMTVLPDGTVVREK